MVSVLGLLIWTVDTVMRASENKLYERHLKERLKALIQEQKVQLLEHRWSIGGAFRDT
jgi:hypothetical protein